MRSLRRPIATQLSQHCKARHGDHQCQRPYNHEGTHRTEYETNSQNRIAAWNTYRVWDSPINAGKV